MLAEDAMADCIDDVVGLTQRLVRVNSSNPPGREAGVARLLAEHAHQADLHVTLDEIAPERANVTVRLPGTGATRRSLLYCGHLDTVTVDAGRWTRDPFGGDVVDGHLWGRGAVDMKGGLAAMLCGLIAASRAAEPPGVDVVLTAVVGEELDCAGSNHFLRNGGMTDVAWMVVGEPTDLQVVVAHKGCARLRVTVRGIAAHASRPELGVNAIVRMAHLLPELTAIDVSGPPHPLLAGSTSAPTVIDGGSAVNVIPDRCYVDFDVRTLPGQHASDILARFQTVLDTVSNNDSGLHATVELRYERAAVSTDRDHEIVVAVREAGASVLGDWPDVAGVSYFTDASVLQPATNVPTVVFGPGQVDLMHQTDERIEVAQLRAAARTFAAIPRHIVGSEQ